MIATPVSMSGSVVTDVHIDTLFGHELAQFVPKSIVTYLCRPS